MESKDLARLKHMLDSTEAIFSFTKIREYLPSFHKQLEQAVNSLFTE
jgi:hypothetical protein